MMDNCAFTITAVLLDENAVVRRSRPRAKGVSEKDSAHSTQHTGKSR